ncbi:MAG: hypothetical protein KDD82_19710, partial [Planctomycetes bacterium]|nr:hypothetical protein [Planctomycetota bacterium]
MARKKSKGKSGKAAKPKKKGGLFGWFGGKDEEGAEPEGGAPADGADTGIPDDFNPERTFVPEYAQDDPPAGAERTMIPGYAGGDLPPGAERTMAPGYAGGDLPFGAERTMAPGYAGGDLPFGAERTMAPGYAGGDLPFGAERTMAPGYAGGDLPPGAEMTMAPGYAGGDPFSFDAQRDLGSDMQAKLAGLRPNQSLDELNPFLVGGPAGPGAAAQAPGQGAPPLPGPGAVDDPFGPPLLDDPYAGGAIDDGEFVGERTMVDIPSDIEDLADLKPTEELLAGEELDLGGSPSGRPATPARSAGARRMFQRISHTEDCVIYAEPDSAVVYDVSRGFVFAPRVAEGWCNVPPNLALLSDGCVIGRGDLDGHGTLTVSTPPQEDAGSLQVKLPASACYDPETRAVFVPLAAAGRISWRPPLTFASDEGVSYTLPEGSERDPSGLLRIPTTGREEAGPHGRALATHSYLGVRESVFADGWACLELPPDAELSGGTLIVSGDGAPPPLLVCERLPDGRWQLELPMGSEEDGLSVWLPPAYPPPADARFDPELGPAPSAVDVRTWAGVRDSLLDTGWIELVLPEASVVEGARVLLPAPYAVALTPELQFELTREDDGRLSFTLPAHSEVLGLRIMIPPAGYTPPAARAPESKDSSPSPEPEAAPRPTSPPMVPTKATAKDGGTATTISASSKTAKALDRFRSTKSGEGKVDDDAKADDAKDDDAKDDDAKDDDAKDDDAKDDDAKDDDAKDDDAKDD